MVLIDYERAGTVGMIKRKRLIRIEIGAPKAVGKEIVTLEVVKRNKRDRSKYLIRRKNVRGIGRQGGKSPLM